MNFRSCAERDRLVAEFEAALDAYIEALHDILSNPVPIDSRLYHIALEECRRRVFDHCELHGCDPLFVRGRYANG